MPHLWRGTNKGEVDQRGAEIWTINIFDGKQLQLYRANSDWRKCSGLGLDSTSPHRSNWLGNWSWSSSDVLKCKFWPVKTDNIYLGGIKVEEESSVSKEVCLDRISSNKHEHHHHPCLKSLLFTREYFSLCLKSFGFHLCSLQMVPSLGLPP